MVAFMKECPTRSRTGVPPAGQDRLARRPRRPDVVDDRGARIALQDRAGQQRRDQVGADDLGVAVDQDRAVRVAVEGGPEGAAVLPHGLLQVAQVLRLERVGLVVREVAVEAEEQRDQLDVELLEEVAVHGGHAVGDVHRHLQARLATP